MKILEIHLCKSVFICVMKIWAAKMLELVGMVVVLTGFLYGVRFSLIRFELGALAVGGAIFYCGWLLEKRQ